MKKLIILFLFFATLLSCKSTCEHNLHNSISLEEITTQDEGTIFVSNFYIEYINALIKDYQNRDNMLEQMLFDKYLTKKLLAKLNDPELDYLPFLAGQDFDNTNITTMRVSKNNVIPNTYQYCYYNQCAANYDMYYCFHSENRW